MRLHPVLDCAFGLLISDHNLVFVESLIRAFGADFVLVNDKHGVGVGMLSNVAINLHSICPNGPTNITISRGHLDLPLLSMLVFLTTIGTFFVFNTDIQTLNPNMTFFIIPNMLNKMTHTVDVALR